MSQVQRRRDDAAHVPKRPRIYFVHCSAPSENRKAVPEYRQDVPLVSEPITRVSRNLDPTKPIQQDSVLAPAHRTRCPCVVVDQFID